MARRRKKTRAAQNAKKKEDQSPMLVDKSLPALPPSEAPQRRAYTPESNLSTGRDNATPTELSPRPPQRYQNESSSRSSSRPRDRDRSPAGRPSNDGPNLTLPTTTYRNNRHSVISHGSELSGGDGESFFIPLALDPSPGPPNGSRGPSDSWADAAKKNNKESQGPDRDHVAGKLKTPNDGRSREPSGASPHIAFQEKGRQPPAELDATPRDPIRKAPPRGRTSVKKDSPSVDDSRVQHVESPSSTNPIKSQTSGESFKLGEVPKGKRAGSAKNGAQSDGTSGESTSRGSPVGISPFPYRKEPPMGAPRSDAPKKQAVPERTGTPQPPQDQKTREEEARQSAESNDSAPSVRDAANKSIARKEISAGLATNNISSMSSSSSSATSPSSTSSSEATGTAPTLHGKPISAPLNTLPLADELASRTPTRPPGPQQQNSTTYMAPRAAPPAPASSLLSAPQNKESQGPTNGVPVSPVLPRWSAGGDFTMDEDMARILGGADETSQSILRRVSNAVRHGRTGSEASIAARNAGHARSVSETTTRTAQSPRWPKTPVQGANVDARDISSPISTTSPTTVTEDPALLRRQLRNSEQRVAELERQFSNEKDLQTLNKKLLERRKTVSVLDSQTEIMIRQLEVLAGYVEKAKDSKQPLNIAELEDSAIKDFVQKLERLKQTMSSAVETLYEERNELLEEKEQIVADRDRALVEFEQLSSKNAQLADMNNDLTHQIQERFKAQSGATVDAPRQPMNVLGIYTSHHKEKSSASLHLDDASLRPSTSTTMLGSVSSYQQSTDPDSTTEPAVLAAPHVVNIRKGQAKKFNWKKGGQSVAKGVSKGIKGAFSSTERDRNPQFPGQTGDNIGLPYNMTMTAVEAPVPMAPPRPGNIDPARQGFGLFKKGSALPKSFSNGSVMAAEAPSTLFGSDLVERAEYERRQIPSVVTRCIEEVELRGMDIEGIYRKTGGSGQVKLIQEGFDKSEDFDISDPSIDITAVTSVLKQYFRKLPVPLLTFDIYDRVLESLSITDDQERCAHLRRTFNLLPPKHRDCLEFLIFHLARVAVRESENLMSPKNLAVVFAPTIMRDHSLEREMTDMHVKNSAVQFVIENSHEIFGNE